VAHLSKFNLKTAEAFGLTLPLSLNDGQVGRFAAFKNATGVDSKLTLRN
jgi:hypothetical protein